MNDKILTIAMFLFFIMIGINAFLYTMSFSLYHENGDRLNIYYGLDEGGFGKELQTNAENTTIGTDVSISSTIPSQQQGLVIGKTNGVPAGLNVFNEFAKIGVGVQLIMFKFSDMFPSISPIFMGIVFFVSAIQMFVVAYGTSILARGILARLT